MRVITGTWQVWVCTLTWLFIPAAQAGCEITKIQNDERTSSITLHLPLKNEQTLMEVMGSMPAEPVDLGEIRHFLDYAAMIQPLLGRDYLALLSSPLTHEDGVSATGLDDLSETINSHISYLRLYARIGEYMRAFVLKHYGVDLAYLPIRSLHREGEKVPNFPFNRVFPEPEAPFSDQDVLAVITELTAAIYKFYLSDRGFDLPAVFTGIVAQDKANSYAEQSLFADDPLFTGHMTHGKFTHILTMAMLMDTYPGITTEWLSGFVKNNHWGNYVDNDHPVTFNPSDRIQLSCTTPSGEPLVRSWKTITWPSGHSPSALAQMVMRNAYSLMVARAAENTFSWTFMLEALGMKDTPQPAERLIRALENIRAFENLIALDFHNDIRAMYQFRKYFHDAQAKGNVAHYCHAPPEEAPVWKVIVYFAQLKRGPTTDSCRDMVDIYVALKGLGQGNSYDEEEFRRVILAIFLNIQRDVDNFYNHISQILKPVRRAWLQSHSIPVLDEGNANYLVYRLPVSTPPVVCRKSDEICPVDR